MKNKLVVLLILTSLQTMAQESNARKSFGNILDKYAMHFQMPEGYSEIAIKENNDLGYYYAIKHDTAKLEIRYTFYPIKDVIERNKTSGGLQADPNKMYPTLTTTNQLNLSGGNEYKITRFAPEAVQGEFHADDGGSTFFPLNSEFGEGYKHCVMVILHKKDIADAFILFLFDDTEVYQSLSQDPFYSLTFK